MKLKFSEKVRVSLAIEIKKVASYGGLAASIFGYSTKSVVMFLVAIIWWLVCQGAAHFLLAMKDEEGESDEF